MYYCCKSFLFFYVILLLYYYYYYYHLQFLKQLLGVKKTTQNDFVYGELGRVTLQTKSFYTIIKYWLKIVLHADENKYIVKVYNMLKSDIELFPNRNNWCSMLKQLL